MSTKRESERDRLEKKRQANIEMLRIILMCTIPLYHLMLYNGVLFRDFQGNVLLGLIFSVGGAIPADYAFMAISAYFLQRDGTRFQIQRVLRFAALLITMYVIKAGILRGLFGFHNTEYFVDFFLMEGAWWYAKGYLVLLCIYPFLNQFLERVSKRILIGTAAILGMGIQAACIWNKMNLAADLAAFVFVYIVMGLLRKKEYRSYLGIRVTKRSMIGFTVVCYLVLLALGICIRIPQGVMSGSIGIEILKRIIGRYNLIAAFMGIAVFLAARLVNIEPARWIYRLSASTSYVFLLHDPVMGVFWYFGKCWNDLAGYSSGAFLVWTTLYLVTCFGIALIVEQVYQSWIAPLWEKLIQRVCVRWKEERTEK